MRRLIRTMLIGAALAGTASDAPAFSTDDNSLSRPIAPRAPGPIVIPRDGAPFSPEPPVENPDLILPEDEPTAVERPAVPPPDVHYGDAGLPEAVARLKAEIALAAKTGDPEALRPILSRMVPPTTLSEIDGGDPIDILKAQAGDVEGREILAILLDVLDAGWVTVDAGTPDERYVWPYFAEMHPDDLTPAQMVELFRIITAGDFEEMRSAGTYVFFRVEIDADGRWRAFMSGE